jgi:arylsulfatase A-like enzyme
VAAHEGVRSDRYKLINFYETDEFNLFDLKNDSNELNNVANNPEYAEVLKDMKQKLADLRKKYKEPALRVRRRK